MNLTSRMSHKIERLNLKDVNIDQIPRQEKLFNMTKSVRFDRSKTLRSLASNKNFSIDFLESKISNLKFQDPKFSQILMTEARRQAPGAFEKALDIRNTSNNFYEWYQEAQDDHKGELGKLTDLRNLVFSFLYLILDQKCYQTAEILKELYYGMNDFIKQSIAEEIQATKNAKKEYIKLVDTFIKP